MTRLYYVLFYTDQSSCFAQEKRQLRALGTKAEGILGRGSIQQKALSCSSSMRPA